MVTMECVGRPLKVLRTEYCVPSLLVITGDVHRDQNNRAVTGDFLRVFENFRELLFRFVDDTKRPETGTVRV